MEYVKELSKPEEAMEEEAIPQESANSGDESSDSEIGPSKPTSLQQKMVALSGQNIDDFMKEMESVHKKQENDKDDESRPKMSLANNDPIAPPGTDSVPTLQATTTITQQKVIQPPIQHNTTAPPLLFRGGLRLPPGPPPGRPLLPPGPPPGLPPRLPIRMPPAPPRILRLPAPPPTLQGLQNLGNLGTPNVLSAAPQLLGKQQGATISAKPQIRNLSADVTRFVPSTLRVKREDKKAKSSSRAALVNELKQREMMAHVTIPKQQTKDDAYMQFMKEMQGLL